MIIYEWDSVRLLEREGEGGGKIFFQFEFKFNKFGVDKNHIAGMRLWGKGGKSLAINNTTVSKQMTEFQSICWFMAF